MNSMQNLFAYRTMNYKSEITELVGSALLSVKCQALKYKLYNYALKLFVNLTLLKYYCVLDILSVYVYIYGYVCMCECLFMNWSQ